MRTEIRIAGTGGMGVVLAGVVLGNAAVTHGGLDAVQTQSYGSEARGTAAKSEVIISTDKIRYPKVRKSDYFIAMSQKALDMYLKDAKKGSVVIIDPDLVDDGGLVDFEVIKIPAMQTADNLGLRLVSNMVMLGALVKKSKVMTMDALEKSLGDMFKGKALEIDIKAIHAGAELV
ncbi:MAG: 2-oxoacid:ferredoxin oxidoreductase subunit gamma [Candidatus Lokiarchaeota archaeon]|nr:2-oxoacid:ferredoxin oxidoreductase subunit gamma [Candidatus Lokiarchaeota archaeon]